MGMFSGCGLTISIIFISFQISSASSQGLCSLVPKTRRVKKLNPIQLLKAIKNQTEIEGMRQAHVSHHITWLSHDKSCVYVFQIKCAVALCEYYVWLEGQLAQGKEVTELSASDKLESYRRQVVYLTTPTIPLPFIVGSKTSM